MPVVSARIDEQTKIEAERIANTIGLSLSTAINVFLNRFVAEQGFPFGVTVPKQQALAFDKALFENQINESIKNRANAPSIPSSYFDPIDQEIKFTK